MVERKCLCPQMLPMWPLALTLSSTNCEDAYCLLPSDLGGSPTALTQELLEGLGWRSWAQPISQEDLHVCRG